ncbi:MAG: hypothetical protein K5683_01615 [Prevotella sp.]|nr:hypothetical protein [Prevotella sp.]
MKKVFIMAFAALAMTFAACGNKSNSGAGGNEAGATAEETSKGDATQVYNNEKYGYTVEVPGFMTRHDPEYGAETGTIFMNNPDDMFDINRIETYGSDNGHLYEPWTPEGVKSRFEMETEELTDVTSKECKDLEFTYTRTSEEGHVTINHSVFSGMKMASVTIDYDANMADKLGGDVAKKIMSSLKIK